MLKKGDKDGVGVGVGGMIGSVGHEDTVFLAEEAIDASGVLKDVPAFRWVLTPSGDEKRTRSHERMEFMKVASFGAEFWVESSSGILGRDEAPLAPGSWM